MAPVMSRSLATASLASLPSSSPFALRNPSRALNLRSAFVPQNGLRKGFSCGGLKWKVENRNRRVSVRCDAAVAEKEEATDAPGEKFEYQAEVSRLMDLIVHSLYSHKKVFLRELVSNASDVLDKLRFLSVTEPSLLGDAAELLIRIKPDPDNGTITISGTGIGMTKEELIDCLGTIAQSGTSKFLKALKENNDLGANNGLIGQFGVGFYSAFLVDEKVIVSTKSPRSDKQYVWEAAADSSSYVIKEEANPENLTQRGTQITLYLRPDDKYEFSEPARIEGLVKNYSQFVSFPIYTWQEKSRTVEVEEEEEPKEGGEPKPEGEKKRKTKTEKYWDWELANETKPIWMRCAKEVQKEEYPEFYKKTFNEFLDPLGYTHFTTEGEVEFRSVLYIPGMGPLNNEDVVNPKTNNIRLYVKRVFISDDFDGELVSSTCWNPWAPSAIEVSTSTHSMVTRASKSNPKYAFATTVDHDFDEPTCFSQADKVSEWRTAMADEFNALQRNGTWSLVLFQPNMNILPNKWVYKIKRRFDVSIERYKARISDVFQFSGATATVRIGFIFPAAIALRDGIATTKDKILSVFMIALAVFSNLIAIYSDATALFKQKVSIDSVRKILTQCLENFPILT